LIFSLVGNRVTEVDVGADFRRMHHCHEVNLRRVAMEVTGIITALVIGLIIGVLGRVVAPGRQNIPLWLTLLVGIVAALVGTAIASALAVAVTPGIDWIELIIQVALAAVGVSVVAGIYHSRRRSTTDKVKDAFKS
jgi:uncharacterized membrane protein YeaQ/YmgE (transglycosylase-associated protein family)